jgi:hypothetical protein
MTPEEILAKEKLHMTIRDNEWLEDYTNRIVNSVKQLT